MFVSSITITACRLIKKPRVEVGRCNQRRAGVPHAAQYPELVLGEEEVTAHTLLSIRYLDFSAPWALIGVNLDGRFVAIGADELNLTGYFLEFLDVVDAGASVLL